MSENQRKKESQKLANEYAKRVKAVLKELRKKYFRSASIKERFAANMIFNMVIDEMCDGIKKKDPEETKQSIETLIKRLMWIIE